MPRPPKKRNIIFAPEVTLFVPSGIPRCRMEAVTFDPDEIEALRLTDMEGLYQGQAAEAMGISRQTLGNILGNARKKATEALTMGKAIRISNGDSRANGYLCLDSSAGCVRSSGHGCGKHSDIGCGQTEEEGCRRDSVPGCGRKSGAGCGNEEGRGCKDS